MAGPAIALIHDGAYRNAIRSPAYWRREPRESGGPKLAISAEGLTADFGYREPSVDRLLDDWIAKVGLDRGTAEKVAQFLKDYAHRLPELLDSDAAKGMMDKLPGGLGGMLGGKG